jgi:hypothetical protein
MGCESHGQRRKRRGHADSRCIGHLLAFFESSRPWNAEPWLAHAPVDRHDPSSRPRDKHLKWPSEDTGAVGGSHEDSGNDCVNRISAAERQPGSRSGASIRSGGSALRPGVVKGRA